MTFKFINSHAIMAFVSLFLITLSFFFSIDTYYDDANRTLCVVFVLLYAWMFRPSICKSDPMINYFGFFIFLFVTQRLVMASFYTAHNWEHQLYKADMVHETIINLSLYIGAFYLVLRLMRGQLRKIIHSIQTAAIKINDIELKFKVLVGIYLVYSVLNFFILYTGGAFGHNNGTATSFLHRYILKVIVPDFIFYITIAFYFLSPVIRRNHFKLGIALMVYFVFMKVIQGSKAGIFELLIIILMYFSLFNNKKVIKVNFKFAVVTALLVAVSILIFSVIAYIQFIYWHGAGDEYVAAESIIKDPFIRVINSLDEISRRLSIIEDAIKVMNYQQFGFKDISAYHNLTTAYQLAVDALIPSTLYPDLLKSQYALALMIGNDPIIRDGVKVYAGYWWGFYGYHHFLFGLYPGMAVMSVFLILNVCFIRLVFKFSTHSFKLAFFFTFVPGFFFNYIGFFGYEHILGMYVYNMVLWTANYIGFYILFVVVRQLLKKPIVNDDSLKRWVQGNQARL